MTPEEIQIRELAGDDFDLSSDEEVVTVLKRRFNIYLPQRRNLVESLSHTNSDHEIIDLLLRYKGTAMPPNAAARNHSGPTTYAS